MFMHPAHVTIRVLETPGHSPGSVTLEVGDVLFTGDTLFFGSMGRTDLRGGSYEDIMASASSLDGIVPLRVISPSIL